MYQKPNKMHMQFLLLSELQVFPDLCSVWRIPMTWLILHLVVTLFIRYGAVIHQVLYICSMNKLCCYEKLLTLSKAECFPLYLMACMFCLLSRVLIFSHVWTTSGKSTRGWNSDGSLFHEIPGFSFGISVVDGHLWVGGENVVSIYSLADKPTLEKDFKPQGNISPYCF